MRYYALIKKLKVFEVIVADPTFIANANLVADFIIDVTDHVQRPGPGWTYNPNTGLFR